MEPYTINKKVSIPDVSFVEDYSFANAQKAPMFDVNSIHGLNQIIGLAKFNNKQIGNVYYRGQCAIYPTLLPALFRGYKRANSAATKIKKLINSIKADTHLIHDLNISTSDDLLIEAILQHYGIKTHFIDIVDNHWIALWMGLFQFEQKKRISVYGHYEKRELPLESFAKLSSSTIADELYQYILILVMPNDKSTNNNGISKNGEFVTVDIRQALPSVFLRPHAQHGIVMRKQGYDNNNPAFYDLSSQIIGILRIRIDRANLWLGNGELVSANNLFPPPSIDYGYDLLLSRKDIFTEPNYVITRFY